MRSRSRQAEPFFYEPDHGRDGVRLLTSATSSKQAALRFGVTLAELRERGGRSADPDDTARTVAYPRTLLRSADNGNLYEIAATFPERQRTELVFTRLMPAEKAGSRTQRAALA